MAEVYRATMPGIGGFEKTVAIKKILPHLTENEEFITMLIDEARIIVSINHFNIAQVYDLGKIEDSYYIAMEYIHGVDISDVIKTMNKRNQHVPVPHAVYIGSSICAGLHVAHAKCDENGNPLNIVHRDISPHNVLLSFAGDVKIIDFGVAKATVKETHTKMGVIKGKLLYMAPEQAMAEKIDVLSDLFAAGLIIYKMLTNRLPFQGENEFQIYNNILTKEITPPRVINPNVPAEVDKIVMKLLARDPDERYQDGYSAKQDLDRALHQTAPGYTVNRLSRFIDENFGESAAQNASVDRSNSSAPVPQTPSGNHFNTGPQDAAATEFDFVPISEEDAADTVNMKSQKVREMVGNAPDPFPGSPPPLRATVSADQTGEFQVPSSPAAPAVANEKKGKMPLAVLAVGVMSVIVVALLAVATFYDPSEEDPDPRANLPPGSIVSEAELEKERTGTTHQIILHSDPEGARVYQDGEVVGITSITLELANSESSIDFTLEIEGFEDRSFRLTPERDRELDFVLRPLGSSAVERSLEAAESEAIAAAEALEEDTSREEAEAAERAREQELARERERERQRDRETTPTPAPTPTPTPAPTPTPPPPDSGDGDDDDIIDPFAF